MSKYNLSEVVSKQAELLEKVGELPATDTSQAILDLLSIQVLMAHIVADLVIEKGKV